jgi:ATP-dependent helicase/nuclease subunit A
MSAADALDRTNANQRAVSDPLSSAWVVANAGSGKTHVLTQRVIRLLLAGADPAAILCLTFTKIAAAEMAGRVFGTLGEWAMLPETALREAIATLQGRPPTAEEMRDARRLFARALETPGGLKIQTIHAFCERLLHQFPFEANVPGQFSVLDDNASAALLEAARAEIMNRVAAEPASGLATAMRRLAEIATDQGISQALDALIAKRHDLRRWSDLSASAYIQELILDLRRRLGLADDENADDLCRAICEAADWARGDCSALCEALSDSGNDGRARTTLRSIGASANVSDEADLRIGFFLTMGDDGWRERSASSRFSAACYRERPGLREKFAAEATRLLPLAARLRLARAAGATGALLVVGDAILQAYHAAKRQAGALDFPDLIGKTRNLLSRVEASAWVLYKLDRRIEHVLVDEAQDTSPDQWEVVKALAEDFFAGRTAVETARTIFAVGDDKQSIFSFQGAAPEMLEDMRRFFEKKIADADASFVSLPLFLSFRSTREVLEAVDLVFSADRAQEITAASYTAHASHRPDDPGHVVVMPRIVRDKLEEPDDWTAPYDTPSAAETLLAENIAREILRIRGTMLPSGKRVRDGEILILVRRRDAFAAAMNRALRKEGIPTEGADRIPVATHIAVLDLLALADVMLLPEDDLQLAALLKSPLLGIGEDELMRLAVGRLDERKSLWAALQESDDMMLAAAAKKLRRWRSMADRITPFRFFAGVLGPDYGRRAFRARLGGEADEVLDTFLSQALSYEMLEAPSLQGFVRFIRANESDIKREAKEGASGVRVMTVHGAKGLEADVVFLVDTGGWIVVPGQRETLVRIGDGRDDPAFLWRRVKEEAPDEQHAADAREDRDTEREYLRLLYVAMTRPRDVLYVAGIKSPRTPDECWYSVVEQALVPGDVERREDGQLAAPYYWPQPPRVPLPAKADADTEAAEAIEIPGWLTQRAPSPARPPQPLRPSQALAEPDPPRELPPAVAAAIEAASEAALTRGRLVHRLMQVLPGAPEERRAALAERIIESEMLDDAELGGSVLAEVLAALADPALGDALGPDSRAEVAIVGNVATERGDYAVSGRIDRLVREPSGWHIIDFKTNRTPPAAFAGIDPTSILQMALYRHLLRKMDPAAEVRATLLFTAGPKAFPVPAEAMQAELRKLGVAV